MFFRNHNIMLKLRSIFLETMPILLGVVLSYFLWQYGVLLAVVYLTLTLALIYAHKDKSELVIFFYGVLVGLLVETVGTSVSGYQSFAEPDFAGIPVWLPIVWGYGFIAMKRIGVILKDL